MDEVEEVALDQLDLRLAHLRLVSPKDEDRLRASIVRVGIQNPVALSTGVETGRLVLIDGFKRVRVAKNLGLVTVLSKHLTLDRKASEVAILECNRPHRGLCDLEEAWVVRSLCRDHKMTQVQVAQVLSRHKSWVCRRLQLAENLEPAIQDDIRYGILSGTIARELVRLPRGNQVPVAGAVTRHELTSRQTASLVTLVLDTDDPEARRAVVDNPLEYLTVQSSDDRRVPRDPRLSRGANEVRSALLRLEKAAEGMTRNCLAHAPAGLQAKDADVLLPAIGGAVPQVQRALDSLRQLRKGSRPERSPGDA